MTWERYMIHLKIMMLQRAFFRLCVHFHLFSLLANIYESSLIFWLGWIHGLGAQLRKNLKMLALLHPWEFFSCYQTLFFFYLNQTIILSTLFSLSFISFHSFSCLTLSSFFYLSTKHTLESFQILNKSLIKLHWSPKRC